MGDEQNPVITHRGGCHCGCVRFEVDAPAELRVDDCNCSMCTRTGYLHLIVTADRFRITQGREALTLYTFNTGTAKHYFCSACGAKPFYVPRSHPDGWSVNARCIDEGTVTGMEITPIDGRNWERQYPQGRGEFNA
ncbi:MAG TPA: GFA family protein [Steroidobacteraceae bacterium]|nr:GFA family protein [Steroidobacteraceae bacterium]